MSKAAQGTHLFWAAPPDDFIFIDADLQTRRNLATQRLAALPQRGTASKPAIHARALAGECRSGFWQTSSVSLCPGL